MLRRTKWTKLPWATTTRLTQKSTSPKKVRTHLRQHTIHVSVLVGLMEVWLCSDYSAGFGGRYGVQADRMDKVSIGAVLWMIYSMKNNRLVNDSQLFSFRVQLPSQTWTLPPQLMRRRSPWRPVRERRCCCTFSRLLGIPTFCFLLR